MQGVQPGGEHGAGVGRVTEHITVDERPLVDCQRPDQWEPIGRQLTRRGLLGGEGHGRQQPPRSQDRTKTDTTTLTKLTATTHGQVLHEWNRLGLYLDQGS